MKTRAFEAYETTSTGLKMSWKMIWWLGLWTLMIYSTLLPWIGKYLAPDILDPDRMKLGWGWIKALAGKL